MISFPIELLTRIRRNSNTERIPDWNLRLDHDWIPTGSRLDPDWTPTGSRLDPDWISTEPGIEHTRKNPQTRPKDKPPKISSGSPQQRQETSDHISAAPTYSWNTLLA